MFKPKYQLKTFTYYLPSPPTRNSAYREKAFDLIISKIVDAGFKIKSIITAPNIKEQNQGSSGLWLICLIQIPKNTNEHIINQIIENCYNDPSKEDLGQSLHSNHIKQLDDLYPIDDNSLNNHNDE